MRFCSLEPFLFGLTLPERIKEGSRAEGVSADDGWCATHDFLQGNEAERLSEGSWDGLNNLN